MAAPEDKTWQEWLVSMTSTITAAILLASGGTLIAVGQQQVKINTQIEAITKLVDGLTGKSENLENRVRTLEIAQ